MYAFGVKIEADLGDQLDQVSGAALYTVRSVQRDPEFEREEQRATGTAFVIDGSGYLLTCEHVARGAVKIDVVLGGKTYPAKVIAQNRSRDLAILKIAAQGLPALPLGDSAQVEQAQNVRAVGFPLSSVLGTSVKITGGAVAGTVEREDDKLFQIDASVNPGNSGGPLVNEQGHVIGVVNAKLSGEAISNVAFAIPSNDAQTWLQEQQAAFQKASGGETLQGPALAKRVVPSVALVNVLLRPKRHDRLQLTFTGSYTSRKKEKRASGGFGFPGLLRPPRHNFAFPQQDRGSLLIDVFGEVAEIDAEEQLPYMQGPLASFVFDPLPSDGETSWQTRRQVTINRVQKDNASPFGIPRPPSPFNRSSRGGRPRSPFDRRAEGKTLSSTAALETVRYSIHSHVDDVVVIRKRYVLKSLEKTETPSVDLQGEGEIRFNTKLGVPVSSVYKALLKRRVDGKDYEVPLTISFTRSEITVSKPKPAEGKADDDGKHKSAVDAAAVGAESASSQESNEAKIDHLLKTIAETAEIRAKFSPVNSLSQVKPIDGKQEAVLEQILPLLHCGEGSVQAAAARAAQHWRLTAARDNLAQLLESKDFQSRWAAIDALGVVGNAESAARLAQLSEKSSSDRFKALQALQKLGEPAVEPLIGLLKSGDVGLRIQVCRVLGSIGGERCAAALEDTAQQDKNIGVQGEAKGYLKRLKK